MMKAFFEMGGYAAYIWPAYGLVCFTFVIHFVVVKQQKKRVMQWLKRRFETC